MATKSDIIKKVVEKHSSLDKMVIAPVVDRFFEILSGTLRDHNRVEFRGFGSFSIRHYNLKKASHLMLNRLTKSQYFKVYFRSSKKLSDLINK